MAPGCLDAEQFLRGPALLLRGHRFFVANNAVGLIAAFSIFVSVSVFVFVLGLWVGSFVV
jgi:hypothetical protein